MSENKNGLVAIAILVGFIILAAVVFFAINSTAFKLASVDMEKVIEKSELGQQINKELQSKGKELQGKIQLAKTDAEKSQINYEFEKYRAEKQQEFVKKAQDIVAKVAKKKGVKAVPRADMYIYTDFLDLTDDVIKELDK